MSLEGLVITDQKLGAGGFSSVFVCKLGEKKMAAKKLSHSETEFNSFVREASRLKRLQYGKHIAYTYGITIKDRNLYMVMEYSERGDLQNYLEKNKESVTYEQKIFFCRGILLGLLYCHSMNVFYGDIKCSNVILGKNLEPKLTDFGLSVTVDNINYYSKLYKGSLHWTAPELFSIKEDEVVYREFLADPYPCDVYSLGATFCEISYDGTTEFIASDDPVMDIMLGNAHPTPKNAFLEEIIDRCCQFERNERISLDECLCMLDAVAKEQLLVPAIDDKWLRIQQDIQANSKLELPHSFILHRPAENLVVGPSNLSLLEWLCINNRVDAVKYMAKLHQQDQNQIKWLYEISELCKSPKVTDFLQSLMQHSESSHLRLSDLIDSHPQQFIEILIRAGASSYSYSLLKEAIEKHCNMIVQATIDSGNNFKNWAIHDAVMFGNTEAVKILANAGANLEWKDDYTGNTPLITAIESEKIEVVKILLGFSAGINNKNNPTRTSVEAEIQRRLLHLAALKGNREIVKLLIDAGATMDFESNEWHSLSRSLEQQGNISMVHFIRNSISGKSSPIKNNSLCAAIQNKQPALVQTLIDNGADIDEVGLDGYAPLHWAVIIDNERIIRILVGAGVDLDIRTLNEAQSLQSTSKPDYFSECTPLHIAISKEYFGIAKLLIKAGADFSAKNGLQQTVMEIAAGQDRKVLEEIIKECAPVNTTSIQRAMESISPESIKIMIDKQANVGILSECLCIAASSGRNDLVKHLLEREVKINKINKINKRYQNRTPLEWATIGRSIQAMEILINANADFNAKNKYMKAPLFRCVWESQVNVVQFLIDRGADINARDKNGNAPIHFVRDKKIAEILIKAGAAIDMKRNNGETLLIQHIIKSNAEIVQFLVDNGASIDTENKHGYAPIHYVNDKEIMKILINAGANVNAIGKYGTTPLIQSVRESNTEMVQYLVDKGADVNIRDRDRNTSIYYADDKEVVKILINAGVHINAKKKYGKALLIQYVKESNAEMVRFLIDKGADINARDKYRNTPIHHADDKEIMEILINAGADVNAKDKRGTTPLIQYAKKSNTEMVQFLLDKRADVNIRDKDGSIPIHYANNMEVVKILINAGAHINAKKKYGRALLIQSIKESNTEILQFLIDKGADLNARDEDGNAPIHHVNVKEIMEILINNGAYISAKSKYGTTPLIQHVIKSDVEMVRFLAYKQADVNVTNKDGYAPIHYADNIETMKILVNAGADVNIKSKHGATPLIHSVEDSNTEIVQFLVDKGADVNARDKDGNTPIYYTYDEEIIKILINAGADVSAKEKHERTLLIQSIEESNVEIVQFLIDKGTNLNFKGRDGNTPIHYANDKEIVKILINDGADVNAKNKYGVTPLIQHVVESNTETVQLLIDKGADAHIRDKDGNTLVHYANDKEIVKILIDAGAHINTKKKYGKALLIQYVKESNAEIVQFLVNKRVNVNARDKDGNMPIHYTNDREIMEILINAGADVNAKSKCGITPLIQHIIKSNAEVVQFLVDNGASIDIENKHGYAPTHYVNDRKIMNILVNAGADVNTKNKYGTTPLIQYVRDSDINMVRFLLEKGADANTANKYGYAPIHYANSKEIMEILINAGADINAKSKCRASLLIQSVRESNTEVIQFLVDKGADVNARDKDGNTPIYHANSKETMGILINAGADINESEYKTTPLIQSVIESNSEMVQYLVDKGADVNARDEDGNVPIHYTNDKEIMEILINAGADVNAKSEYRVTPLIQSIRESNIEMVQFLVDKGADINAVNEYGYAPIHYVKNKEVMEILINADADVNAKSKYGVTPLIQHIIKSDVEMVGFLVNKQADVNTKDEDGNIPIHYTHDMAIVKILINAGADINAKDQYGKTLLVQSAQESNTEMVRFLLDKGADVNVRDKDGNTPIYHIDDEEIVKILIDAGADISVKDKYVRTLLIQSIKESNTEMVQYLVDKGAGISARDKYGNMPIHYANDKEIMSILIDASADVNAIDKYGKTPLIQSVIESNVEVMQFLIDKKADVNAVDKYRYAPIHYVNDREIMKILINAGADVNAKDKYRRMPLIHYVKESNTEMVQFLVDKGADVNARDKDGNTSIHHTQEREIMEILINADADINAKNQYGRTLLIQFVVESNAKVVRFLVDKGADVNAKDKDGNMPIHHTQEKEIMRILINAGADVNAKNEYGRTPLIRLVRESNAELVQFLLDNRADINTRDEDGNTLIYHTYKRKIMEILINAGTDVNAKSQHGKTPLVQSVIKSNTEMVQFLVDKGADVNTRGEDGNAPIHFVRDEKIVKILVKAGADINAKDRHGKELFSILREEYNKNSSNNQYKGEKFCKLLEYLRDINKI